MSSRTVDYSYLLNNPLVSMLASGSFSPPTMLALINAYGIEGLSEELPTPLSYPDIYKPRNPERPSRWTCLSSMMASKANEASVILDYDVSAPFPPGQTPSADLVALHLIERGASVSTTGQSVVSSRHDKQTYHHDWDVLDLAFNRRYYATVKRLLAPDGPLHDRLSTIADRKVAGGEHHLCPWLHVAVEEESIELVKLLLGYGCDPNGLDHAGRSALFRASTPEMVETLVNHGADGSIRDDRKYTCDKSWGNRYHAPQYKQLTQALIRSVARRKDEGSLNFLRLQWMEQLPTAAKSVNVPSAKKLNIPADFVVDAGRDCQLAPPTWLALSLLGSSGNYYRPAKMSTSWTWALEQFDLSIPARGPVTQLDVLAALVMEVHLGDRLFTDVQPRAVLDQLARRVSQDHPNSTEEERGIVLAHHICQAQSVMFDLLNSPELPIPSTPTMANRKKLLEATVLLLNQDAWRSLEQVGAPTSFKDHLNKIKTSLQEIWPQKFGSVSASFEGAGRLHPELRQELFTLLCQSNSKGAVFAGLESPLDMKSVVSAPLLEAMDHAPTPDMRRALLGLSVGAVLEVSSTQRYSKNLASFINVGGFECRNPSISTVVNANAQRAWELVKANPQWVREIDETIWQEWEKIAQENAKYYGSRTELGEDRSAVDHLLAVSSFVMHNTIARHLRPEDNAEASVRKRKM